MAPSKMPKDSDLAMRKHGAHVWTDTKREQTFWCFCSNTKDHKSEPRFA